MKKLMISTAFAALAGTAAVAQDTMFRGMSDPLEIHASEFIGKRVYASEAAVEGDSFDGLQDGWEDIGEINDVILSRNGTVDAVLVDIGGFLGIGERQVAVDMTAIKFVSDDATADDETDFFLVMNANRANFEEAPEYSWADPTMEEASGEVKAEGATADEGVKVDDPAAAIDVATGAEQPAGTEAEATATVDETAMAPEASTPMMKEGYEAAAQEDLTTEMLTGAKVYDANDEWIGEVSELIVDDQGQITNGIVDVGGFLGIGEKPVELALADIDILRENGGDDVRVYVSMTREQLEELPTYDK